MVKPEWGAKRSCPKCGERFYDLGEIGTGDENEDDH